MKKVLEQTAKGMYPYQLGTMPVGCYCSQGYVPHCPTKAQQTDQLRQQFIGDWVGALAQPTSVHVHNVGQQIAFRYGWQAQRQIEQLLRDRAFQSTAPHLQAQQIYDAYLGRTF